MLLSLKEIVQTEFGTIANRFETIYFCAGEKPLIDNPYRAGVYVFFMGDQIWKIGKHNKSAYTRCLQHFADDTGSNINKGMRQYEENKNMQIVLFLLKDSKRDLHWIYALECFLETYYRNQKNLVIHS